MRIRRWLFRRFHVAVLVPPRVEVEWADCPSDRLPSVFRLYLPGVTRNVAGRKIISSLFN